MRCFKGERMAQTMCTSRSNGHALCVHVILLQHQPQVWYNLRMDQGEAQRRWETASEFSQAAETVYRQQPRPRLAGGNISG